MENAVKAKEGLLTVNSLDYFDYSHKGEKLYD